MRAPEPFPEQFLRDVDENRRRLDLRIKELQEIQKELAAAEAKLAAKNKEIK